MRISLTNGKKYRLSWRHIDASRSEQLKAIDPLVNKSHFDKVLRMENMFQERLKQAYQNENDFAHHYERMHGVTDCFFVEIRDDLPLTQDPSPTGEAWCSVKDAFDKAKGRKVSLNRALDVVLGKDRILREQVWDQYFERNW